jgi:hypothetical protein
MLARFVEIDSRKFELDIAKDEGIAGKDLLTFSGFGSTRKLVATVVFELVGNRKNGVEGIFAPSRRDRSRDSGTL